MGHRFDIKRVVDGQAATVSGTGLGATHTMHTANTFVHSINNTHPAARTRIHGLGKVASTILLCAGLLGVTATAHADDLRTILGGGVGAAAGTILGQSVGGRSGAVIGGALGGATGAAVTTRGPGQNGAVIGGAVGGAAGAAVGQSTGGRNGAVLGAGLGGAAGATIGRGVGRDNYYQQADYRPEQGYRDRGGHGGYDRWDNRREYERNDWRKERHGNYRRHDQGHHFGHNKHHGWERHHRGHGHGHGGHRD